MASKDLVWIDLETTGLDPKVHGIVQIAMIFEVDGKVVDSYSSMVDCSSYDRDVGVNQVALNINNVKEEDIPTFKHPKDVLNDIRAKMNQWYGSQRISLGGYNVSSFDKLFLEDFYKSNGEEFWKTFNHKPIDVFELYKVLQHMGVMPHTYNQKLVTLVKEFGIATDEEIADNAHNAIWDIEVTKGLYDYARDTFVKAGLL